MEQRRHHCRIVIRGRSTCAKTSRPRSSSTTPGSPNILSTKSNERAFWQIFNGTTRGRALPPACLTWAAYQTEMASASSTLMLESMDHTAKSILFNTVGASQTTASARAGRFHYWQTTALTKNYKMLLITLRCRDQKAQTTPTKNSNLILMRRRIRISNRLTLANFSLDK